VTILQASDVAVTLVAVGCNEDKAEPLYLLQTKLLSSLKANEINTSILFIIHIGDRGGERRSTRDIQYMRNSINSALQ